MTQDELQSIPINICPKLFFEALLLDIRGETIRFASAKKKSQTMEYDLCMHKVEELEVKLHGDPDNDVIANELSEAKDRLEARHKTIAEGAAVRSRAKYYIDGEKPTRLFCSLEQKNGAQKFIPSLKIEVKEGEETRIKE